MPIDAGAAAPDDGAGCGNVDKHSIGHFVELLDSIDGDVLFHGVKLLALCTIFLELI